MWSADQRPKGQRLHIHQLEGRKKVENSQRLGRYSWRWSIWASRCWGRGRVWGQDKGLRTIIKEKRRDDPRGRGVAIEGLWFKSWGTKRYMDKEFHVVVGWKEQRTSSACGWEWTVFKKRKDQNRKWNDWGNSNFTPSYLSLFFHLFLLFGASVVLCCLLSFLLCLRPRSPVLAVLALSSQKLGRRTSSQRIDVVEDDEEDVFPSSQRKNETA